MQCVLQQYLQISLAEALCRTNEAPSENHDFLIKKDYSSSWSQPTFQADRSKDSHNPICSFHSPPLPLTILPIPDVPATISLPSLIMSALVQVIIIGTPAEFYIVRCKSFDYDLRQMVYPIRQGIPSVGGSPRLSALLPFCRRWMYSGNYIL